MKSRPMLAAPGGAAGGASLFGAGSSGDSLSIQMLTQLPFEWTSLEPGLQLAFERFRKGVVL